SFDELERIPDPSAVIDAVLVRTNCGAPCDFGYLVYAVPRGQATRGQPILADLYHVAPRESGFPVAVRWHGSDSLVVEYRAKRAKLQGPTVQVAGRTISVVFVTSSAKGSRQSIQDRGGSTVATANIGCCLRPNPSLKQPRPPRIEADQRPSVRPRSLSSS